MTVIISEINGEGLTRVHIGQEFPSAQKIAEVFRKVMIYAIAVPQDPAKGQTAKIVFGEGKSITVTGL